MDAIASWTNSNDSYFWFDDVDKTQYTYSHNHHGRNKANLKDLIVVTGLIKLDSNHQFYSPCDLEIWLMTYKNYRAPLLHYIKLCASSQTPRWLRTGVTVRKWSIEVKMFDFQLCVTLKFDGWSWKTIGHLFYVTLSFVHHFKAIGEFKLKL